MKNIKAISFDLDDTLWECDPVIQRAEQLLVTFLTDRCDMIRQRHTLQSFADSKIQFMRDNRHLSGDVTRMRKALLGHMLEDCETHRTLVDEAFDYFYKKRSEVELFEDCLPALERLKSQYDLAALTNGNADLDIIGIKHLFAEIHFATLECPAKPEPDMFHRTCDAFGIAYDELLHVGDNPLTDIEGARNAGARTVWINRFEMAWPDEYAAADYVITDLNQLTDLLTETVDIV